MEQSLQAGPSDCIVGISNLKHPLYKGSAFSQGYYEFGMMGKIHHTLVNLLLEMASSNIIINTMFLKISSFS
jgi:hypothetical protein